MTVAIDMRSGQSCVSVGLSWNREILIIGNREPQFKHPDYGHPLAPKLGGGEGVKQNKRQFSERKKFFMVRPGN